MISYSALENCQIGGIAHASKNLVPTSSQSVRRLDIRMYHGPLDNPTWEAGTLAICPGIVLPSPVNMWS